MLISPAYAQEGGGALGGLEAFIPLILIFVIFYFLLIRPQQRKMKDHRAMLEAIRRGDRIVTAGGLIGTVTKVPESGELTVEVAEGVRVKVMREMVGNVLSRTEPAGGSSDGPANENKDKDSEGSDGGSEPSGAGAKLKGLFGKK